MIVMNDSGSYYFSKVFCKFVGDLVILFNGIGGEYYGLIEVIIFKLVQVLFDFFVELDWVVLLYLYLGQVMGKGDYMDYVL